jgi:hypothetical protein
MCAVGWWLVRSAVWYGGLGDKFMNLLSYVINIIYIYIFIKVILYLDVFCVKAAPESVDLCWFDPVPLIFELDPTLTAIYNYYRCHPIPRFEPTAAASNPHHPRG